MTLKEWDDFNHGISNFGDWIVCILKRNSFKNDDIILESKMRTDYAVKLFGNYEMKKFMTGTYPGSEYNGLRILLWEPEHPEEMGI